MSKKVKYTNKQIEEWKMKAEKWDALDEKIGKFYPEDEESDESSAGDLGDIGEVAAMAFGYL